LPAEDEKMLEKRITELAKMVDEIEMFSGIFKEFYELIKKIPVAPMLRFKDDQRTVL
jgi:hypothetical protein